MNVVHLDLKHVTIPLTLVYQHSLDYLKITNENYTRVVEKFMQNERYLFLR